MMKPRSDYEAMAIESPERRATLARHGLAMEATQLLSEELARQNLSKKELSERLGRTRGFVSQVLSGTGNLTLKTLAQFASTLGIHIHFYASRTPRWNIRHDRTMKPLWTLDVAGGCDAEQLQLFSGPYSQVQSPHGRWAVVVNPVQTPPQEAGEVEAA